MSGVGDTPFPLAESTSGTMGQRVLSAAVALPLLFLVVWLGDPWYTLVATLIAVLGAWEFYRLAGHRGGQHLSVLGGLGTLLFLGNARLGGESTPLLLTALVMLSLSLALVRFRGEATLVGWLWTLGGMIYVGWLFSHFVSLRILPHGREWVLLVLGATFAADTCAFLVGRAWGRRPLAPSISPGKTWEGAVAGFLGAVGTTLALGFLLRLPLPPVLGLLLGGMIGTFGQLGDLAESMLKRGAGVKEAGHLIPGHGGLLDRLDSLVFTGPVVYYFVTWVLVRA